MIEFYERYLVQLETERQSVREFIRDLTDIAAPASLYDEDGLCLQAKVDMHLVTRGEQLEEIEAAIERTRDRLMEEDDG